MWFALIFIGASAQSNSSDTSTESGRRLTMSSTGNGLTFGFNMYTPVGLDQVIRVGCSGSPGGSCNAYSGDTSCTTTLPVLCVRKYGSYRPCYSVTSPSSDLYNGWVEGSLALTKPVQGNSFASKANADTFCAKTFGVGWMMSEFHDGLWCSGAGGTNAYCQGTWSASFPSYCNNRGGWNFYGWGNFPAPPTRFWVYIDDQPANCFP